MGESSTIPLDIGSFLQVPTLAVKVVEGPDKGLAPAEDSEVVTVGSAERNTLRLGDGTVSRYHLELAALSDGVGVTDLDSTNGTWLGAARIERAVVPMTATLRIGRTHLKLNGGQPSRMDMHPEKSFGELRGNTAAMRQLMARLEKAAKSDVAVLIEGESGTGKELVARALHDRGARGGQPFMTLDCAAIAPNLVSSELFGHERGAFTGAHRRHLGAFERASGGTLFLDEIGELPGDLQAQLLGVLERRMFRRVGGHDDLKVDVRVISATNRDLRVDVNANAFRLDLYYRIAVVRFRVPPLRKHAGDIPLLVEHFLRQAGHAGRVDQVVPRAVMKELCLHRWPGNVRELRNIVEASLAMGEPPRLMSSMPPSELGSDRPHDRRTDLPYKQARATVLQEFELRYLRRLLDRADENVSKAARLAGMDRSYLIQLLRKHELS